MFLLRHLVVDAIGFISILHFSLPLPVFNLQQYKQDVCVLCNDNAMLTYHVRTEWIGEKTKKKYEELALFKIAAIELCD